MRERFSGQDRAFGYLTFMSAIGFEHSKKAPKKAFEHSKRAPTAAAR
jgi:hypothetical protein